MQEPGELELLILPYLSDELGDADTRRVELQIATDPAFSKLVEEFRTTLSFFEGDDSDTTDIDLDNVLDDLYREVSIRDTMGANRSPWRRYSPAPISRLIAPVWAIGGAVAACLFFAVVGFRHVTTPMRFSAIAEMSPTVDTPVPVATVRQDIMRVRLIERLEDAQMMQYGRGDSVAALSLYDDILHDKPELWARTVADARRAEILRTAAPPMSEHAAQPVFLQVIQP